MVLLLLSLACTPSTPTPTAPPDPCAIVRAPAPGPRSAAVAAVLDEPLRVAELRIEEARITGDVGFYTLAEQALACSGADTPEANRLRTHIAIQFHQFAEAEQMAKRLAESSGSALDWMLLGDTQMEQGKIALSAESYQQSMDLRPGLAIYDRVAWLRWLTGDFDGAMEAQRQAVSAGSPGDPEPYAWVLTRLGWLRALRGEPAVEIESALALLPDYPQARFARGRIRLFLGQPGAAEDLRAAGRTVEAFRALAELDPTVKVTEVGSQDARGYALWLADTDPARALVLAEAELSARQDAVTHMVHAWVVHQTGGDATAEARAAVDTGCLEPRVLLFGGLILKDSALLERALAFGPGLLPSERARAEAALKK